jgi:hypothetical protein
VTRVLSLLIALSALAGFASGLVVLDSRRPDVIINATQSERTP